MTEALKHPAPGLRGFLNDEGRLTHLPAKHKKRQWVYLWAASLFTMGATYTERQVNEVIDGILAFDDTASLRRALVDYGFLSRERDGSAYWPVQPQPTPESLGL